MSSRYPSFDTPEMGSLLHINLSDPQSGEGDFGYEEEFSPKDAARERWARKKSRRGKGASGSEKKKNRFYEEDDHFGE